MTKCKYSTKCKLYSEHIFGCNQGDKNEDCVQYIMFEEENGNFPYFALKYLGKLKDYPK